MEQSRGRIISIADDLSRATVEVNSASICARCASGKGCGAGILGNDGGPRRIEAPLIGHFDPHVGDEVRLELAPQSVLRAALVVYGAPLAGVLIAAGVAHLLGFSDARTGLAVALGVMFGAFISRRRLQRSHCLRQFTPAITGRLAGAE